MTGQAIDLLDEGAKGPPPQPGDWALYRRTGLALGQWAKEKLAVIK
jgi:hypothetical protein